MDQIPAMSLDMVSGTFSSRKQRDSADSAVQNMVGEVSSGGAWRFFYRNHRDAVKTSLSTPFLCRQVDSG